jgi:prephenate dehydrogenase
MNQHRSHCTSEFVRLANDHHIRPFSFISHLTHCMQSLNVEIFHSYKKHHDNVIKQALAEFHLQYSLKRFCNDLSQIREHTFKETIIRSAFEKSDMWSVNSQRCIDQLKKFAAPNMKKSEPVRMLHDQ